MSTTRKGTIQSVIILLLIASVLRVATAIGFPLWSGDADRYDRLAINLTEGNGYSACEDPPYRKDIFRPPLYPLFLSSVYRIFGHKHLPVRIIQALLDTAACFFFFLIAKRVFGDRIGLISLVLIVFYPFTIYYVGGIQTETLFTLFISVITLLTLIAFDSDDWRWSLAVGVSIGVSVLCRSTTFVLPVFLGMTLIAMPGDRLKAILKTLLIVAGMILVISPWAIRNYLTFNQIIPVAPGFKHALWVGSHDYYMKKPYQSPENDYTKDPAYYSYFYSTDGFETIKFDNELGKRGIDRIQSEPGAYLAKTLKAVPRLWISSLHPALPFWLLRLISLSCWLVLGLGVAGILMARGTWVASAPLLVLLIYFSVMYAPLINQARYTVPVRPILLIYVAIFVGQVLQLKKRKT